MCAFKVHLTFLSITFRREERAVNANNINAITPVFRFCDLEFGDCHSFDHKKEATRLTEGSGESTREHKNNLNVKNL